MAVIDTNSTCTQNIETLQTHNVTAVGRYHSTYKPNNRILRAEAEALIAAGMKIFVVFENCANPVLTLKQGTIDATYALRQAAELGQPHGSAIYFAAEGLPDGYTHNDINNAKNYFTGINSVIGQNYKVGVYSNGVICKALRQGPHPLCSYAWLSASLSFEGTVEYRDSHEWALFQRTPTDIDWDGLSIDNDDAAADFGAFDALVAPQHGI
jgi:hypothetical protein